MVSKVLNFFFQDLEYARYIVYEGDYYKTKFQFYEMYQKDILERIRLPVDRDRWVAGAALVNAFYSPNTNEISSFSNISIFIREIFQFSQLEFFNPCSTANISQGRWIMVELESSSDTKLHME